MPKPPAKAWKDFQEKILHSTDDYEYRYRRYDIGYSVAIAYAPDPVDTDSLCTRIRRSDRHIVLDEHTHAVVFDCTDDEKGIKASNNLLTYFQSTHFSQTVYAAIVSSGEYPSAIAMISKLFFLLEYAIVNNMDNLIIDKTLIVEKKC